MSTLAIPSGSRFRHAWHRRCRAAGLLLVCATAVSAQRFQFDYGKPGPAEVGTGIVQVAGGYVVAASNGADILGLGVDQTGTELLDACHAVFSGYGATLTPHCLRQTSDDGFIVAGEVIGNTAPSNQVFLAKFDKFGALTWPAVGPGKILCYHGDATGLRQGTRVVEMSGGGYGVITNVDVAGNSRGVLFTVAASGLLTCWDSYAYGSAPTLFHDLRENADGTFTIVGTVKDSTTGRRATLLLRTLPCGATPVWQNQYGFLPLMEDVEQQAITTTKDGGFVVWGHYAPATSPFPGSFLLKVSGAGVPLWRQRFPLILGSRPTIVEAPNGDLLCNGRLGNDALVMRTDPAGVIKNVRTYGGAGGIVDEIFQVVITDDGGFAAVGSTQLVSASTNVYLLKGDAELHTGAACFELTPNINQSRDTPPPSPEGPAIRARNGDQLPVHDASNPLPGPDGTLL